MRLLIGVLLGLAVLAGSRAALAAATPTDPYQMAQQQMSTLDSAPIQGFVQSLDRQLEPYGVHLDWGQLTAILRTRTIPWQPQDIARAIAGVFVGEVRQSLRLLGELLVLVVLAAILRHIQASFEGDAVGRLADAVVFLALGAIVLVGFVQALGIARGAVKDLSDFMLALLPTLFSLLVASGAFASAGLLHPAILFVVNLVGWAVGTWVFPLLLLAAVLDIVSSLNPTFRLSSMAGLMRQVALGATGLLLAGFIGVVSVEGAAGAVADGVALRAAKYAAKTFVPVVGGVFADAAELVITSGFLVKTGLGIAGLLVVALAVLLPVAKLIAIWLCFRLAAALAQPVGGEGVVHVLGGVSSTISLFAVTVGVVGLMFFLSLTVLVGASSAVMMLR
ncbi:MAG TPA: stage III sporulation protein AE [Bacillota bacterium]|nr:stage III sporulation protein AE [Bacillota bacterium]